MCVCVIDGTKGAFLNTDRRWRRHTARIYSVDRTRAREGERRERGRAVIRYLGGGEGRLCQQLSGNRLALQITGFCVNVLTHRCLDYTKWSRAKVCRFVASNSRFPSSSVSSMLLIINDRTQREHRTRRRLVSSVKETEHETLGENSRTNNYGNWTIICIKGGRGSKRKRRFFQRRWRVERGRSRNIIGNFWPGKNPPRDV